jgi:hypothetical protein
VTLVFVFAQAIYLSRFMEAGDSKE